MRPLLFSLTAVALAGTLASCRESASHQPPVDTAMYVILPYNDRAKLGMNGYYRDARYLDGV